MTRFNLHSILGRCARGTLALGVCAFIAVGCSTATKIAQSSKGNVYLEEVTDWSFEASHPAVIDQATMLKIVKGVYSDESQNGLSRMSAGGAKPMRIFSDEDAEFLAPLLAQGLSKAKPEQIVGFRVSSSAGSGSEPTAGSIYVKNDSIYITIARGAKASGFMPDSVARVESAPSYAAGGAAGVLAMVIDYHALAKAPVSTLPVAKAGSKTGAFPTPASLSNTGTIKPQAAPASAGAAIPASDQISYETAQMEKIKETLARKDTEINMLRKESEWMKRELRDRDEEIKALRASKISTKPAPKKRHAEVSPTR